MVEWVDGEVRDEMVSEWVDGGQDGSRRARESMDVE